MKVDLRQDRQFPIPAIRDHYPRPAAKSPLVLLGIACKSYRCTTVIHSVMIPPAIPSGASWLQPPPGLVNPSTGCFTIIG